MSKTSEITQRNTTAELYHTGHDASSILKLTKYANPKNDEEQTPCFLSGLKWNIEANPLKLIAKLAKSQNVSKMTISKAVRKDLKIKTYCKQRHYILTAKLKAIRIERSPLLLNHLKNCGGDVRIFMDEKKFIVDKKQIIVTHDSWRISCSDGKQTSNTGRGFFSSWEQQSPLFIKAGTSM